MWYHKVKFFSAASLTALFGMFQMGYHSSVINIPEPLFFEFLNETSIQRYDYPMSETALHAVWGLIVSIMFVGSLIGSLFTPILAEKFGRKMTFMVLSNILAISASILMSCTFHAGSFELLAFGRLLIGISAGISTTILPVYLTECSPTKHRGVMGTLQTIFLNLSTILASMVAIPEAWGTPKWLPLLLGFGIVPAVLQILTFFFFAESPKYLYINRKDKAAAKKSLQFWNDGPHESREQIEATFREFDQEADTLGQEIRFHQVMKIPYFRKILIISVVLTMCQASSGINAVICYSADMFLKLGFDPTVTNICTNMLAVTCAVGAFVTVPCVEKFSRRLMYFSTYIILVVALLLIMAFSISYDRTSSPWSAYTAMASMFLYASVFGTGAGGLTSVLPSELSPQSIRSTVNSVASAFSWGLALVTTFAYPPARHLLGAWSYLLFLIPLIIGLVYLYRVMPETAGKSIAEIVQENSEPVKTPNNGGVGRDVNSVAALKLKEALALEAYRYFPHATVDATHHGVDTGSFSDSKILKNS